MAATGILWLRRDRSRASLLQIAAGWLLIPLVYLAGSPFTLLDFDQFWRDFSYIVGQYMTTGEHISAHFLVDPWTGLGLMLTYASLFALGIPAIGCALLAVASAAFGRDSANQRKGIARRQTVLTIALDASGLWHRGAAHRPARA